MADDSVRPLILWAELSNTPPEDAEVLLMDHGDILAELARIDATTLERAAHEVIKKSGSLPLSAWLDAAQRQSYEGVAESEDERRRQAIALELLERARDAGIVRSGDPLSDHAVTLLRQRTDNFMLAGRIKRKRRWERPTKSARLSLPLLHVEPVELLLSRILNPDGVFSIDARGATFITQQKGYQRAQDERIYVDGVCRVVDAAADLFWSESPDGGRLRITSADVRVVREDRPLAAVVTC